MFELFSKFLNKFEKTDILYLYEKYQVTVINKSTIKIIWWFSDGNILNNSKILYVIITYQKS